MAITYTEQFETKRAIVEMTLSDGKYSINYTAVGDIDGTPDNVTADIFLVVDDKNKRVGYGSYANGVTRIHFDSSYVTTVSNQAAIASQFYNDLQSILG